tara:strand:- start:3672 stop:4199 length:528 start_codon:yes stop_codon:yes gene_type:complete
MLYKDALKQALERYELLISKYKTPLDIPTDDVRFEESEDWVQGRVMEVGKWYLWVDGGNRYKRTHPFRTNMVSSEQHIIMIPKIFEGKLQTVKDFDALWYLTGPNSKLFDANYIDGYYIDEENIQWHDIKDLKLGLDSFGIPLTSNWVIGPLEGLDMLLKSMDFLNWNHNPLEVK